MASTGIYIGKPILGRTQMTAANTNRDGTGTTYLLYTSAQRDGTRLGFLEFTPVGTIAAGVLRIFTYDGVNYRLWREVQTAAQTPSGTVAATNYTVTFNDTPYVLPSGSSIYVSTHNAEVWNVHLWAGDY